MDKCSELQPNKKSTVINKSVIPDSLKNINHWICWRSEKGKKVPYGEKNYRKKINATDPNSWLPFERAFRDHQKYSCSGIGFVLDHSGIIGIDLDDCVAGDVVNPEALALLDALGADYVEFSPSGLGLRSFAYGTLDKPFIGTLRGIKVEI
ncbi:MAG: hypothetical protein NWS01_11780 [Burkholderiales bacterium]|nr:hypothetical protein [Burkholderiales bacterium]